MGKSVRATDDGLPILSKPDTSASTDDGLPVLKKKEDGAGPVSPASASASTITPPKTERATGTLDLGLPLDDILHQTVFGGDKGPAPLKQEFRKNYQQQQVTPTDVKAVSPASDNNGLTDEQIAQGVNNKGKNLQEWGDASQKKQLQADVQTLQEANKQLDYARTSGIPVNQDQANSVAKKRDQARSNIQKAYDVQKKTVVPELIDELKKPFGDSDWNSIYENPDQHLNKTPDEKILEGLHIDAGGHEVVRKSPLQWNPETHKLTPESAKYINTQVDDILNRKGNDVLNAQVSGDTDKKERTYEDIHRDVINYFNTVVPVQHAQQKYADAFAKGKPEIKDAIRAQKEFNSFFNKDNVEAANAYANTWRDKEFMKTKEKYYGKAGIFNTNPGYVEIAHKYAGLVAEGKMTDEVARKEIDSEVGQNPALKKIKDNLDREVKGTTEKTQDMWQQFVINGLKKVDNKLTVYKDGTVGLDGVSNTAFKALTKEYDEGYNKIPAKVLGDQAAEFEKQASAKAKAVGPFWASVGASTNEMYSAFSKLLFNKTQWGGDQVRYFEAQESSSPQASQSDEAKRWNWKGVESLADPKFWAAKIGGMVPVLAGAAAVSAVTEGEAAPAYVSWLANAGLFTAQSGLSAYGQLLNTKDANGNQLTEADASHYMAEDMKKNILPNLLMMAATSGTLFRARNIVKPTLAGAAGKGVAGAAIAQPFFTWQGYNSYANMQEAQGKKTDIWDYMQTPDFRDNVINGMVVGSGLSLLHAPGAYMKGIKSWTDLVHTSEGEFRNLSMHNFALQQEMGGNGNFFRDAMKMHVFNMDREDMPVEQQRQMRDMKDVLQYSVNLDRNIKGAGLDPTNVKDLYQAHNLALADSYDEQAEKNKDNKNLSSIYSDKAKEYREQAKQAADGTAKFHYLINDSGKPIFLSDNSFKALDREGKIADWMKKGTIEDIHSSDEPGFSDKYKQMTADEEKAPQPFKPKLEEGQQEHIIDALRVANAAGELSGGMKGMADLHLDKPESHQELAEYVISQGVDNQSAMKEALGKDAYWKIEGIIKDQKSVRDQEREAELKSEKEPVAEDNNVQPAIPGVEYKPNIRDDYFAQADFFTPEEKEKFSTLDDSGKNKMIDEKRDELKEGPVRSATNIAQPILDRMNNAEYINEKELNQASDSLYELMDNVEKMEGYTPEQKESVSAMIEPLIKKIEDYDFRTKTKTSTVAEKVPTQVLREGKKREIKPALEKSKGGQATVKLVDGTEKAGILNVKDGNYVLDVPGEDPVVIGEKAINDRDLKLPSEEKVEEPIQFDKDGNVKSVTFETRDGKLITINDPEKALDIAIQLRGEAIGEIAPEQFETVWNEVQKEIQQEVPVKDLSLPKTDTNVKDEKTDEAEGRQEGDVLNPKAEEAAPAPAEATPPPKKPKPPKPEVTRVPSDTPREEFTGINKLRDDQIPETKALFERQKQIKWEETYDKALKNVMGMFPGKGLYDAMKARVQHFVSLLDSGTLYNPTSEDIAVFNVLKDETKRRINEIQGWDSNDNNQRLRALAEYTSLYNDLYDVSRVNNPGGEAGRAFVLLQSDIAQDPNYGLQIRRMELLAKKRGKKMTEAELASTSEIWEQEKEELHKLQKATTERDRERFEKKLSAVKDRYEKLLREAKAENKPGSTKEKREKLLTQKGAELAEKIRSGKLKGTYATFPGLPQAINVVLEGIAKLVEGGYNLAQAIDEYVKANKIKNREQFQNDLFEVFNKQEKQEDSYDRIRKMAATDKSSSVTKDMVEKNLIRDYIDSHVGLHDPKDVLDVAHAELKKILPDLEKDKLREAYLKQGDFAVLTKKELESGFKESQKKFERLTKLEKDIADLNNKGDLYKKKNNRVTTPFDKEIEAKENERKAIINQMGIKTGGEDKYTKASYEQRATAHNDRLDALGNTVKDKLNTGGLSPESDKALNKLNTQLEAAKIKIDPTSASSQDKSLAGGASALKDIKNEFDRSTIGLDDLKDVKRELQRVLDRFNSDKEDSDQSIKLQRAKDQARRDSDKFLKKIVNGEYEDKQSVVLTRTDAEMIKIDRNLAALRQLYDKNKSDYERRNKSGFRRVADFARAAMVDYLIGSPFTVLKVAGSALLRPAFEAATKLTFGKAFEALPFDTTRVITEKAREGGESSSLKSIKKGYEAYLRQYSPKQLSDLYQKANDKYEQLDREYQQTKDAGTEKEVSDLKNKRDDALIDAVGNSVYHFIAGSSIIEAQEVLLHRSTQMERQYGNFDVEGYKKFDKDGSKMSKVNTIIDNVEHTMNFIGRSHAALKNFSARQSFASGFMARLEDAVNKGVDISQADKQLELAHQSYMDWERGKYQESNWLTDKWNELTNAADRIHPAIAYLMRADVAITRVPVNMLREGIMEYTLGAFRGSVMAAREYYKAKGIVLQDGYTTEHEANFKSELRDQLNKIDPDKAATIIRAFRKGGFGAGLYALALIGHASFGGWPHKGQTAEDKKKAEREEDTGIPEIKTTEMMIGNWKVPEVIAKIAEHTPAFTPLGFGLGLAQVYKNNIINGKSTPASAENSMMAQINHVTNSLPMIDKFVGPLATGALGNITPKGQWDDVDQDGNPMKRKAFHMSDYLKYLHFGNAFGKDIHIGSKKEILSEYYYKEAVKNQKYYRDLITEVETNTSLSAKEKEEQRQAYLKDLNESIEEVYKQNKENPQ